MPQATMDAPAAFAYRQRTYEQSDTAGQLEGLKRDGFALIPGVLKPDEVVRARQEIDRLRPFGFDNYGKGGPGEVDHFKCVFNRDPYWLQFLDHPGVIELSEAAMGADCHSIGMSAWRSFPNPLKPDEKDPGRGPSWVHTDWIFFPVATELLLSKQVELPIMGCTAHFYLTDITIDLCPTWVLPGSHLYGTSCNDLPPPEKLAWNGNQIQPVLCKAGDVLFFRSEVWHSGSRNFSNQPRYLLQTHLGRRSVAQRFSPYLDFRFNQDVVAQATKRQRRMMGDHERSAYD